MNELPQNIETEALSLPEQQRTHLVLKLLESIEHRAFQEPERVERAWLEEANRRYQAYLSGEEEAISAEQVFAELRAEDH
jgi:putative addiction module component (TIGR02574 family)